MPFEKSFRRKTQKRGVVLDKTLVNLHGNDVDPDIVAKIETVLQLGQSGHAVLTPNADAACKSFCAHYAEYSDKGLNPSNLTQAATV
jgi:hypothetical protein